eukprot:scaffold23785_cov30-Prasinocladus_malaysianus.AAC.1
MLADHGRRGRNVRLVEYAAGKSSKGGKRIIKGLLYATVVAVYVYNHPEAVGTVVCFDSRVRTCMLTGRCGRARHASRHRQARRGEHRHQVSLQKPPTAIMSCLQTHICSALPRLAGCSNMSTTGVGIADDTLK